MAPKAKQEAKFDWWHPPGSWGKLVPLRCRLLKGVHLDLSNSATKCNQSWAADFLPSSWRTRKNTLILLACNRINKKHTNRKNCIWFFKKTGIAWHPRHHESIGPQSSHCESRAATPCLWFAQSTGICIIYIIYIYALMSVKICENAGTPNHSSSAWLSLVEMCLPCQMLRHEESQCMECYGVLLDTLKIFAPNPFVFFPLATQLSKQHNSTYCNPIAAAARDWVLPWLLAVLT